MRTLLTALTLTACTMLPAAASAQTAPYTNNITAYQGIQRYTGPERYAHAPSAFNFTADGASYLELSRDRKRIVRYDTRTGKELETLMDLEHTRETTLKAIDGYTVSPDGSKILVRRKTKYIYRHSYDAEYFVYEMRTRLLRPLSTDHQRQQAPLFSPDGRMVAFVAGNNIYIKKLDYQTEIAVTTDGAPGQVINGIPDWTYEEEFTTSSSMTWSPDNLTLCFIRYDESKVPLYSFPLYEGACDAMPQYALYPGSFTYKYPVAGQPNSVVSVRSYDIETRKLKDISLPNPSLEYIPRISYAYSPDRLLVVTLNRAQTRMEIFSVNPRSTVARSIFVEQTDAWLPTETYENLTLRPDGFVVMSSRTGYAHLYQYSYAGALTATITSGDYDVTAYYGYNERTKSHFYQSAMTGPLNRVVSKVDAKGKRTDLSPTEGTGAATFSPDMSFYTLSYNSVNTPPRYELHSTAERPDKAIKVLEDNKALAEKYAAEPRREFFTMESDGVTLNGWMLKPADFSASHRYPVVMFQYSGPGSQQVLNRWSVDWANYYASRGYIVACVDGRGTGARGYKFMTCTYKNLGHYETIDQVNAAKYMAALPYVDANRIGIHGWSYGGYETLMAASHPDAPYAAAVAVAPVTDWRYYDTVYAERYMLTPGENAEGYAASAPLNRTANVKCPLLIMTGTADDNVHFSNTVQYVAKTQMGGGWCDMLIFPNMNHFINGCDDYTIVYARMLDYFERNMPAGR